MSTKRWASIAGLAVAIVVAAVIGAAAGSGDFPAWLEALATLAALAAAAVAGIFAARAAGQASQAAQHTAETLEIEREREHRHETASERVQADLIAAWAIAHPGFIYNHGTGECEITVQNVVRIRNASQLPTFDTRIRVTLHTRLSTGTQFEDVRFVRALNDVLPPVDTIEFPYPVAYRANLGADVVNDLQVTAHVAVALELRDASGLWWTRTEDGSLRRGAWLGDHKNGEPVEVSPSG